MLNKWPTKWSENLHTGIKLRGFHNGWAANIYIVVDTQNIGYPPFWDR